VCSHGSVSTTTIERAILVLTERFEQLQITFGYAHKETLTVFKELILMHWRQKTKETHSIVVHKLTMTIIAIISKEKNSRCLYDAAKMMTDIYLRCGLHEEAQKLLREIHTQIISKTYTAAKTCGFEIDHSVGKGCYVFLATFEEIIHGSSSSTYSTIMASLLTESIFLELYHSSVKSSKSTEVILLAGARLYDFLETSHRKEQLVVIQQDLVRIFTKKWGSAVKTRNEITIIFLISLLRALASDTNHTDLGHVACKSSHAKVHELLSKGEYIKAYEVALCAFQFLEHQKTLKDRKNI